MSTSEQQTLPDLLAFTRTTAGAPRKGTVRGAEPLSVIREHQARAYRLRIFYGVLLASLLHVALFVNFAPKAVPARKHAPVPPIEVVAAAIEIEPPEVVEEPVDLLTQNQPLESIAPSLPDPMRVALSTDFVTPPTLPPPAGLVVDGAILRIPSSSSQGNSLGLTKVFSLAELDRAPELQQRVNPLYPVELQGSNIAGVVVVHFVVNAQGDVLHPEVISSPHPALGLAVVRAIEKWHFKAGLKAGRSVSTDMELPVRFNLQ